MTEPLISVVIPTRNRRELLQKTLEALDRQTGLTGPFEVVVADDGSSDGTAEYLGSGCGPFSFTLVWLRLPAAGPAAARNRAIAKAKARRVLLLGDDTLPDTGVVASHLSIAEAQVGLQGRIEWDSALPITPVMRFLAPEGPQFYFKGLRHARPIPYTALYASNLSAPTDWFREEPFDEGFPAAAFEDSELSYRWHRRGWTVLYWESAVCLHRHHYESLEPFLSRQRQAGQGARFATRRHPGMAAQTVLQPFIVGLFKAVRYGWRRLWRTAREADLWDLKVRVAFFQGYLVKPARHSEERPAEAPATESHPKISVIVPVRDDPLLDRLLASLAAQRHAPPFEVVIALDGSRREPNVPPGLAVRLLRLTPKGPYSARNAAIAAARGEILVLTDSDCVCPSDWIALAERAFRDPSLSVLQGSSRPFDRKRLSRWAQQEYERYVRSHAADAYRHFCDTRNIAIRADLARVLPFPEDFPKGGDGVYGRWLERKGIAIRYEPRWSVTHRDPSSRWRLGRTAFERGRYGEQWRAAAGIDLFGDARGPGAGKGPGSWLLRRLPKSSLARRLASAGLLGVAAILGSASALAPEKPGQRLFSLFRRACHLSGRLYGESLSGASAGRAS